ncbi:MULTISPECIES: transposase [Microbulbifer]|uniref:Transposase n=1 Tax=Microbulbifer celer TaxID=435905 RepID=A0ABW3U4N2_9GAMM|nr:MULTISPECIES: transposase [Microbulbifer]UFN56781.1 transposase [Microbulbifer celer]
MPRLPRLNLIDIPQHIVQVGHNNLPCFFDEEDYQFYLLSLRSAADQYRVDIHAYVLLPNMVQIIGTPRVPDGVPSMMQSLGRRYVQFINHRYKRSGTLWAGRYKSSLIDSDAYLLTCYRYVELRPLYLGLADSLGDYRWSSFNHHASVERSDVISDHWLYLQLGDTPSERAEAYRKLFRYRFDRRLLEYIAETIKVGQVLGGDVFKEKIEQIANQRVRPLKRGRPRKSRKDKVQERTAQEKTVQEKLLGQKAPAVSATAPEKAAEEKTLEQTV